MSLKKTESTQHKLKQTCQLRLWLIVGGVLMNPLMIFIKIIKLR